MAKRKDAPRAAPTRETGLIGGVGRRAIIVVPNCSEWPRMFRRHAKRISEALGTVALGIDHIGSTAVPGLASRPIIDMLVVVANSADEDFVPACHVAMRLRVREPDLEEHRMFRTPGGTCTSISSRPAHPKSSAI